MGPVWAPYGPRTGPVWAPNGTRQELASIQELINLNIRERPLIIQAIWKQSLSLARFCATSGPILIGAASNSGRVTEHVGHNAKQHLHWDLFGPACYLRSARRRIDDIIERVGATLHDFPDDIPRHIQLAHVLREATFLPTDLTVSLSHFAGSR